MEIETIKKLAELFSKKSPAYSITSDGRIMAVCEQPLSDEEIKELGIGRFDAYENLSDVLVPYSYGEAISKFLDGIGIMPSSKQPEGPEAIQDALDVFRDAVSHIQYQAMIEYGNNCMENSPRNPDGSFKID